MPAVSDEEKEGPSESVEVRKIRLAIVDDHEMLLESFGSWISSNAPEFEVVLLARSWLELIQSPNFPTDLVFLDFMLKEAISIEARVRTCRAAGAKVIILSSLDLKEDRDRGLGSGAEGFLTKSMPLHEIMSFARNVMGRESGSTTPTDWRPLPTGATKIAPVRLSRSEETALKLYVSGMSTTEVAENMGVRYETAKTFLRRVREKYSLAGRSASKKSDLLIRAAEDGYLE